MEQSTFFRCTATGVITLFAPYLFAATILSVEFEDYDNGGPNVGFLDSTSGNSGTKYRQDDVDIRGNGSGGFSVGWTSDGEYLNYTRPIEKAGQYRLDALVAGNNTEPMTLSFHLTDGSHLGTLTYTPKVADVRQFQTETLTNLFLPQGVSTIQVRLHHKALSLDKFVLTLEQEASSSATQYGAGSSEVNYAKLPGIFYAADYSGYLDTTAGNAGGGYRQDDVDIRVSQQVPLVGWTQPNEYLRFETSVAQSGAYDAVFYLGSDSSEDKRLTLNNKQAEFSKHLTFNTQGSGAYDFNPYTITGLTLLEGRQQLEVVMQSSGFRVRDIHIVSASDIDNDWVGDNIDLFPNDSSASVDSDQDGYPDHWNSNKSQQDSTTGLVLDAFPNDPNEQLDSDKDGVGDNADIYPLLADLSVAPVMQVPGLMQAEHFRQGPNGSAYFDSSVGNAKNNHRLDVDVDIHNNNRDDEFGNPTYGIGNTTDGEWLEYDIDVVNSGLYQLTLFTGSSQNTKPSYLTVQVNDQIYPIDFIASAADARQYQAVLLPRDLPLISGLQRLRIGFVDANGATLDAFSLLPLPDADNDGVSDGRDAFPDDHLEWLDSDLDGIGNNRDAFPNNPAASIDADRDGFPDQWNEQCDINCQLISGLRPDELPSDADNYRDSDNDGLGDNHDDDDQRFRHTSFATDLLLFHRFEVPTRTQAGEHVIGRIQPIDNRFAPQSAPSKDLKFVLTHDESQLFHLTNVRDQSGRLFGVLSLKNNDSLPWDSSHLVEIELRSSTDVVARVETLVHAMPTTTWAYFFSHFYRYATEESYRLHSGRNYDFALVEEQISALEQHQYRVTHGFKFQHDYWLQDDTLPIHFYQYQTDDELANYGQYVVTPDVLADELEQSALHLAALARAYVQLSEYQTDPARSRLEVVLLNALEAWLDAFPSSDFGNFSGVEFNDTTHAWRFTDPIAGVITALHHPIHTGRENGEALSQRIYEKSSQFFSDVAFDLPQSHASIDFFRFYNTDDLSSSPGAWSDANRAHRLRTWAAMVAFYKDYNRPITYNPLWYHDYEGDQPGLGWASQDTTLLPGWSPRGSFADLKFWIDTNGIEAQSYGRSGLLPDGTMSHHTGLRQDLAMYAYGYEWLTEEPYIFASYLKDTVFEPSSTPFEFSFRVLNHIMPWLLYGTTHDFQATGRSHYQPHVADFGSYVFSRDVERLFIGAPAGTNVELSEQLSTFITTLSDNSHQRLGSKAFWANDYLIHRREKWDSLSATTQEWFSSVKMESQRTRGAESFSDSAFGFMNGRGVLQVKTHPHDYTAIRYDWDWHLLPGITESWRQDPLPLPSSEKAANPSAFSSVLANDYDLPDNAYSMAAFEYASDHSYTTVAANKSYFFLDEAVVALGNSIRRVRDDLSTPDGNANILTVIDQVHWQTPFTFNPGQGAQVGINGVKTVSLRSSWSSNPASNPSLPYEQQIMWFHQGNKGYVVFPQLQQKVRTYLRGGDTIPDSDTAKSEAASEQRLKPLLIAINHGKELAGDGDKSHYAYAILPFVSAEEMPERTHHLLQNLDIYQQPQQGIEAIYYRSPHSGHDVIQAVFRKAGTLQFANDLTLSVDKPALVQMIRLTQGEWNISVTDPYAHDDPEVSPPVRHFRHHALKTHNEIILNVNLNFIAGVYPYLTQGIKREAIASQQVLVSSNNGHSQLTFQLPDHNDSDDYQGRQNLYLGMPASIRIDETTE